MKGSYFKGERCSSCYLSCSANLTVHIFTALHAAGHLLTEQGLLWVLQNLLGWSRFQAQMKTP